MKTHYLGNSKKSGIYKILNTTNGRFYIGSAKSFIQRMKHHLKSLKEGTHHNKFLQNDFKKCGSDSFEFFILEVVDGPQDVRLAIEQNYLNEYHDQQTLCYNLEKRTNIKPKGPNKQPRKPLTDEAKSKIGIASKAMYENMSEEDKARLSEIRRTNAKNQWNDPEARSKRVSKMQMNSYKLSDIQKEKAQDETYKTELMKRLEKANEKRPPKTVMLINPVGEVVTITNLYRWCRENHLSYEALRSVLRGMSKSYQGWKNHPKDSVV